MDWWDYGQTQNPKNEGFSPAIDNKHAQKRQVGTKGLISIPQGQNCESDDNSQRVPLKDSHLIDTNIENPTKTNETVSDKYNTSSDTKKSTISSNEPKLVPKSQASCKPSIYMIGNTDKWGCRNCRIKDDKWAMQDHICSGDNNGNNDTASKRNSVAEAVNTEDKNYGGRKCPSHWHEDDWLGNLYIVGKDGTKEECIKKHRVYFYNKVNTDAEFKRHVSGLRGQRIGCPGNCKPGPCHLDVIVDYVNT